MENEDYKKDPAYEVCLCKHITRADVEKIIKDKNIKTLKELCKVGDVGNKCGGCREDLESILSDVNSESN